MRKLLSEDQQLPVRNFQALRRRGDFGRAEQPQFSLSCRWRACFCLSGLSRFYHVNPNRNAVLRFNLADRNGTICAGEHSFNQTALRVARTISKLWHRRGKIIGNSKSETGKWLLDLSFHLNKRARFSQNAGYENDKNSVVDGATRVPRCLRCRVDSASSQSAARRRVSRVHHRRRD